MDLGIGEQPRGLQQRRIIELSERFFPQRNFCHAEASEMNCHIPRKGTLALGSDADIVLWDPERQVTIRNEQLHHRVDYTPYEGVTVKGWPVMTFSRGELVCRDGEVTAAAGRGQFLPCDRPEPARVGRSFALS